MDKKKQQEPSIKSVVRGLMWVNPLEPREAKPTLRVPLIVIIVMTLIIALAVQGFPPKVKGSKCHLPILSMVPKGK